MGESSRGDTWQCVHSMATHCAACEASPHKQISLVDENMALGLMGMSQAPRADPALPSVALSIVDAEDVLAVSAL